jgi:N-acyl-L-homoserine lactone synthetase
VNKVIVLREGVFTARELLIDDPAEMDEYHLFRGRYFDGHLHWGVSNGNGHDRDRFDPVSVPFGLFSELGEIIGCIRITPHTKEGFMVDHNPFRELIDPALDPKYPRSRAIEVSRLGILPKWQSIVTPEGHTPAQLLYRAAYQWAVRNGKLYWYIVAYHRLVRHLVVAHNFPFKVVGKLKKYDQWDTCAAAMDLCEAHDLQQKINPTLLQWYDGGMDFAAMMRQALRPIA